MLNEKTKMPCDECAHKKVCRYSKSFCELVKQINNLSLNTKTSIIVDICGIGVTCKYFCREMEPNAFYGDNIKYL